jgi:hypothetical protein
MASENSITIEGVDYSIDDFELGDLEWLEDFIGKPLTNLNNLNSVKASVGLIYVIKRRENPAFTIDDARKTKMTAIFGGDGPGTRSPPRGRSALPSRPLAASPRAARVDADPRPRLPRPVGRAATADAPPVPRPAARLRTAPGRR